jgi:hypothetical protein
VSAYRLYDVLDADGYPPQWHATVKDAVREAAGNRCVRCGHPYAKGDGEWSPCDERCAHGGPVRFRLIGTQEWGHLAADEFSGDAGGSWIRIGLAVGAHPRAAYEAEARWRILTVHHLDGNKANCRWWNLVALCQRCHLQIQGKVQMARVWPWEHSDWFKFYVAGYYAWTYLGEDLTRDEVQARLDELLALESAP